MPWVALPSGTRAWECRGRQRRRHTNLRPRNGKCKGQPRLRAGVFLCAQHGRTPGVPDMGAYLRVQVPPKVGHDERSETQLHEGD